MENETMMDKIIGRIQGLFFGLMVVTGLAAGGIIILILWVAVEKFDNSWLWFLPIMVAITCLIKIAVGLFITWPLEWARKQIEKKVPWLMPAIFWALFAIWFINLTNQ
jgi:hypothetical protein